MCFHPFSKNCEVLPDIVLETGCYHIVKLKERERLCEVEIISF